MKRFSCGDVVPGCQTAFEADSDDEVLAAVATHARAEHDMLDVPEHVLAEVRSHIVTVD